jgi:hypothetical protein
MRSISWLLLRALDRVALTCEEASAMASRRLDMPLSVGQRCRLGLHFAICKWCRRYARQIELLRRAMRRLAEPPAAGVAAVLPAGARERIKAALRESSA